MTDIIGKACDDDTPPIDCTKKKNKKHSACVITTMTTSSSTTSTTTAISASAVHDPAIVAGVHKAERLGATGAETIRLLLAGGTMIAFGTSILVRTHRMRAQHL